MASERMPTRRELAQICERWGDSPPSQARQDIDLVTALVEQMLPIVEAAAARGITDAHPIADTGDYEWSCLFCGADCPGDDHVCGGTMARALLEDMEGKADA